jgi:hypothetical protein
VTQFSGDWVNWRVLVAQVAILTDVMYEDALTAAKHSDPLTLWQTFDYDVYKYDYVWVSVCY